MAQLHFHLPGGVCSVGSLEWELFDFLKLGVFASELTKRLRARFLDGTIFVFRVFTIRPG